jgi:hypothetical protein
LRDIRFLTPESGIRNDKAMHFLFCHPERAAIHYHFEEVAFFVTTKKSFTKLVDNAGFKIPHYQNNAVNLVD